MSDTRLQQDIYNFLQDILADSASEAWIRIRATKLINRMETEQKAGTN